MMPVMVLALSLSRLPMLPWVIQRPWPCWIGRGLRCKQMSLRTFPTPFWMLYIGDGFPICTVASPAMGRGLRGWDPIVHVLNRSTTTIGREVSLWAMIERFVMQPLWGYLGDLHRGERKLCTTRKRPL